MTKREIREKVCKLSRNEETIQRVVRRVLETVDPKSDSYVWVVELATLLNQTTPCDKCDGTGHHDKHKNCFHCAEDAYIKECRKQIRCAKCHGTSRLPLSIRDAQKGEGWESLK
jgi:hypothetical protein